MFDDFDLFCRQFWGYAIEDWQREWMRCIVEAPIVISTDFLQDIPESLGPVTKMRRLNNRVIAETESGIPMIVPARAVVR